MNTDMINEVTRQVLDQIRDSATVDEAKAAELHNEAKGYREQAAAYEAHATNADANALIHETAGQVKRQFAALLAGQPGLPTPGAVVPIGELGMGIGVHKLALPGDIPLDQMTPEQVTSIRDLMEAVYGLAFDRLTKANGWLRAHRSTLDTATLSLEDVPGPDPLKASPAEESGAHQVVPASGRPFTPDRKEVREDGREYTVVTSKRCCNGCGQVLGDVTEDEVVAVVDGNGLPDVRDECPSCSKPNGPAEPDVSAQCSACQYPLILIGGEWLHAITMDAECQPGAGAGVPVNIVHRDPAREAEGEPLPEDSGPEMPAEPKRETALQGIARIAGKAVPKRHKAAHAGNGRSTAPDPLPVQDPAVDGDAAALMEVPGRSAYPEEPAVPTGDPAQVRMDEIAAQRREDRSPWERADDPTALLPLPAASEGQMFPPAHENGGGR